MNVQNRVLNKSEKVDVVLSKSVAAYFLFLTLNSTLKNIFRIQIDSVFSKIISLICITLMLYYIFGGMRYVIKRIPNITKVCYLFFVFIYTLSIVLITSRNESLNLILYETAPNTFIFFLPIGLCAYAVVDKDVLYKLLFKWSFISSFALLLSFLFRDQVNDYGHATYDMSFGIYMILPTLLHINHFRKTKNIFILWLCIIEVATLVLYANRSVLLSIGFYFIGIYFCSFKKTSTKIMAFITLLLLVSLFFVFYDTFTNILENFLIKSGVQSRTLTLFVSERIIESNERLELWEICNSMIRQKPILGWGIGGEYFEIARQYGEEASKYHTPHNGLLQCFVHFGILGGFIACVYCIRPIFQLNRVKDSATFELVLIFISYGIIPRLISSAGFFVNPSVAVALFLFYNSINYKKKV